VFVLLYGIQDLDNAGGLPADMFDDTPSEAVVLYENKTMRLEVVTKHTYKLSWAWYGKSSVFSLIEMDFNDFNSAFAELRDMGLVFVNAAVFDHHEYDGEIIGSTHGYDYVEELDVAIRRKRKTMAKWPEGYYMIIPAHIKTACIKCVGVMRYRAQTGKTARWMALSTKNGVRELKLYNDALRLELALAIERERKSA
jgi:hypothetical protein